MDRLLVITFTRMATGELRERVRERLVSAHDRLDDVINGIAVFGNDELVDHLAAAARPEQEVRRARLASAIADFDAATIETTHGFCLQVLYGLGTAGDVDREVTLVDDVRDLLDEVVDDLYLRKFARRANDSGFSRRDARAIAREGDRATPTPWCCRWWRRGTISRASGAGSPGLCTKRWSAASEHSRSSPTTTCSLACATHCEDTERGPLARARATWTIRRRPRR